MKIKQNLLVRKQHEAKSTSLHVLAIVPFVITENSPEAKFQLLKISYTLILDAITAGIRNENNTLTDTSLSFLSTVAWVSLWKIKASTSQHKFLPNSNHQLVFSELTERKKVALFLASRCWTLLPFSLSFFFQPIMEKSDLNKCFEAAKKKIEHLCSSHRFSQTLLAQRWQPTTDLQSSSIRGAWLEASKAWYDQEEGKTHSEPVNWTPVRK